VHQPFGLTLIESLEGVPMKTFLVLFAIAISLPTEAQRVKENVRQRFEIVDISAVDPEAPAVEVKDDKKKVRVEKVIDAVRK
jgi:hypothetical protein